MLLYSFKMYTNIIFLRKSFCIHVKRYPYFRVRSYFLCWR